MPNVAPTKTNLLKLRQELAFAQLGHELLDQKRNILVIELLTLVDQTVDFQARIEKALAEAYSTLEQAVLRMGRLRVTQLAGAVNIRADIHIRQRRVMGVALPVVETRFEERPPFYSPLDTSFWIDRSVRGFKEALELMGDVRKLDWSRWGRVPQGEWLLNMYARAHHLLGEYEDELEVADLATRAALVAALVARPD